MANLKHLAILKKGVDAWNKWRKENTGIQPDLSEAKLNAAKLNGADLSEADLDWANLSGVELMRADLSGAKLGGAKLIQADLRWANLSVAQLSGANLSEADLRGADLTLAELRRADLTQANLGGANLSKAIVGYTAFANVYLSGVKGLETVTHRGPSTIGIDTVYRSQGKIPDIFLRGAGVPENFIAYMHSLVRTAFDYYSCFISYSSKDQQFADRLYADLQAKGVRCWLATEDLKIGDKFRQRIDEAIRSYDKLVVVLSKTSVKSTWVESEVETAFEKERVAEGERLVLFPIRLDEAVMEAKQAWAGEIRRQRHIGDFSAWQDHNSYQTAFTRLLRDLQGKNEQEVKAKAAKK